MLCRSEYYNNEKKASALWTDLKSSANKPLNLISINKIYLLTAGQILRQDLYQITILFIV